MDSNEVQDREKEIASLQRQRQLLEEIAQLGGQGAGQAMAQVNYLTWVINESETRLLCLKFILARPGIYPAAASLRELVAYNNNREQAGLGIKLTHHYIEMSREDIRQVDFPGFDPSLCAAISRRISLTGLPGSTTVAQVARGVSGLGGVLNIFVSRDLRTNTVPGQLSAVVEFASSASASDYVRFVRDFGVWFEDNEELQHEIMATKILTPSNQISRFHPERHGIINNGSSGRCLRLEDFPIMAIWALFKDFGVRHIIDAWITTNDHEDSTDEHLSIEFSNIFESTRFTHYLLRGYFHPYRPSLEMLTLDWTTSDRHVQDMEEHFNIHHVPHNHIEDQWDKDPYNKILPKQLGECWARSGPVTQAAIHPSHAKDGVLVRGNSCELRHVPPQQITTRMSTDEADYILIQDDIFVLVRFSISPYDCYFQVTKPELDRLKALYVSDPAWQSFWDEYCKTQEIDFRGYYAYAEVAAARRENNKLHGRPYHDAGEMLEQATIPECIISYARPDLIRKVIRTSN